MIKVLPVMLAALTFGSAANATGPCTPKTTHGEWMYTCEGHLSAPTRIPGTCTASKSAYWTCSGTANLGGQIFAQGLSGQATNQADCTGNINYTQTLGGAPAGALEIAYVISEGGDAISGLPTNSGGVLSCSLRRIGRAPIESDRLDVLLPHC